MSVSSTKMCSDDYSIRPCVISFIFQSAGLIGGFKMYATDFKGKASNYIQFSNA